MNELVLAGDIGGTKTILQLVRTAGRDAGDSLSAVAVVAEQTYASRAYADLVPMVQRFLDEAKSRRVGAARVQRACFGIAGPVINQTSKLTNLKWSLSAKRLQHELGLASATLLNDFAAIGYGLKGLKANALVVLQPGKPDPTAPIAVIGAGTGLGEGFLIPDGDGRYRAFPSEGGHTDFPARSSLEAQLIEHLRGRHDVPHISVERVVSGPGIASIYDFLAEHTATPETPGVARVRRQWRRQADREGESVDLSAAVSRAALAGRDALCGQTMRLFVEAYGVEAGNLALKVLCKGGLYVAGGIAPKILPLLRDGTFLEAFRDKGRMRPLLEAIPVKVVLNPKVGLIGAALFAVQDV